MDVRKSWGLLALVVALGGCVEVVEEEPANTPPTQITDVNQGSNVTSASAAAATVGTGSVDMVSLIGQGAGAAVPAYRASPVGDDPLMDGLVAAAAAMAQTAAEAAAIKTALTDETKICAGGGTVRIQKDTDLTSGTQVTAYTYTDCRQGDALLNGSSSMNVAPLSVKIRLGGGNGVVLDGNDLLVQRLDAGDNVVGSLRMDVTFVMVNESTDMTTVWRINANGRARNVNADGSATFSYDNFRSVHTSYDSVAMGSDVLDGAIRLDWSNGVQERHVALAYDNFKVAVDNRNSTYSYTRTDGTVSINFTPDVTCNGAKVDGKFNIVTNTAVKRVKTTGKTVAGEQVINDKTTITYNADGTVTVAFNGFTQTIPDAQHLEGLCPLPGLSEL